MSGVPTALEGRYDGFGYVWEGGEESNAKRRV